MGCYATREEAAISPSWKCNHCGKAHANGRLFISQSGIFLTRSTPGEQQPAPKQILGLRPSPTWANVPGRKSSKGCSSSTRKRQSEWGETSIRNDSTADKLDDQIQVWKGNKYLRGSVSQKGKFPHLMLMPFVHFLLADWFVLIRSISPS